MSAGAFTHRHDVEAAVYDARVRDLFAGLCDADLEVDASRPPFPNREHVDFLGFALARLGPVRGKHILEVGCGTGALAVYLAQQGARVTAIDLSTENVRLARRRVAVNGVTDRVDVRIVPAEALADPDVSYDAIIGNQVLHHFELDAAMPNLRRLMRPEGIALFCEPVMLLPHFFRRIRNLRWLQRRFPSRADTPTERSISWADLQLVRRSFPVGHVFPFQLFTRLQNFRELSDRWFYRLERLDRVVLRWVPVSRRLCRFVAFELSVNPLDANGWMEL
jgi:2-polyprenyl-3-methyl-5-hydroxy-6-metoxy-1,4-benzoquinol methylase